MLTSNPSATSARPRRSTPQSLLVTAVGLRVDNPDKPRQEIELVDHEQVGARYAGAAFAWDLFACSDVDHVDSQVRELGTKGCREIVATRLHETQLCPWEFQVHILDCGDVHGGVLTYRGMRA